VLRRILGRRQNMLRLPGGERRWPLLSSSDIAALLAAVPGLRQYRIVQKALDHLHLVLAVARPPAAADSEAAIAWARAKFGAAFRVTLETCEELPRSPAGKSEDFVCEIP
jgi:phenylacetate-CoA ligase